MPKTKKNANAPMQYPEHAEQTEAVFGWLKDFFGQFTLAWKLLLDGRVPLLAKIIPLLAAAYVLFPIDFVPDVALGFGQLDDLAIFLIGLRLFIDVCPPDLVAELQKAANVPAHPEASSAAGPVIDLEARVPSSAQQVIEEDKVETPG